MNPLTDEQRALAGAPENIAFALAIARQMARRRPLLREEFECAALFGLCAAAGRYSRGAGKFTTFAYPRVAGAVLDVMREALPLGWRAPSLRAKYGAPVGVVQLGDRRTDGGDFYPAAKIDNGELPPGWAIEWLDTVGAWASRLPPRHGAALREYFTRAGRTMAGIGASAGLSECHVSRTIKEAVEMIRENLAHRKEAVA